MNLYEALDAALAALECECESFWQSIVDADDSDAEHARVVIAGHAWLRRNLSEIVAAAEIDRRDDVDTGAPDDGEPTQ